MSNRKRLMVLMAVLVAGVAVWVFMSRVGDSAGGGRGQEGVGGKLVLEIADLRYSDENDGLEFDFVFKNQGLDIFGHENCALRPGGVQVVCVVDDIRYDFQYNVEKPHRGIGVRIEKVLFIQPNQVKHWRMDMGQFVSHKPDGSRLEWVEVARKHVGSEVGLAGVWVCGKYRLESSPKYFELK